MKVAKEYHTAALVSGAVHKTVLAGTPCGMCILPGTAGGQGNSGWMVEPSVGDRRRIRNWKLAETKGHINPILVSLFKPGVREIKCPFESER